MARISGDYASGISLPFTGDGDGGLRLVESDKYVDRMVILAVLPNESDNPFQDIGGTVTPIFKNSSDRAWKQFLKSRIKSQFSILETNNLARLTKVEIGKPDSEGNVPVEVRYINLETGAQNQFVLGFDIDGEPILAE